MAAPATIAAARRITAELAQVVSGELAPQAAFRVLLVSSHAAYREALRELLDEPGRQVQAASDGQQALQLLPRLAPQIVLCDGDLRGHPGPLALARVWRLSRRDLDLCVLLDYATDPEPFVGAGFNHVLVKSPDLTPLRDLLHRLD